MIHVLAIDPGACSGWASGTTGPGPRLLACGVCYPDRGGTVPAWYYDLVIIEKPVLTKVGPGSIISRGNDLITCYGRGMRLLGGLERACKASDLKIKYIVEVPPGTWKGQVAKDIHNARILAKLTPQERSLVPENHNAIDAVGLLLYALERFYP
jgi:hypothetical protein